MPVTGAATSQLIRAWSRLPSSSSQAMNSISSWPATRQAFLPNSGSRDTSMSVPRWACSLSATIAPRKVTHTNSQRETSSDTVMPELKP
ncbi:hypothetical protein D3C86_1549810 [compost metagenome]